MTVAFRADASTAIGTGHVMRCLTLAGALAARGSACAFVTRDLPGGMADAIAARGFAVALLPAPGPDDRGDGAGPHGAWAGVAAARDAAETAAALERLGADRLVVDHYAFDARWERAAAGGRPVAVIDDLADRPHACDLLLDQNLGRAAADYDGLVPDAARRLIGPRFALLRPEFAAARAASLSRRADGRLRRLLVAMGGVDAPNATGAVLAALEGAGAPRDLAVDVVLGPAAPHLAAVRAAAAAAGRPTAVHVGVTDMAALMAAADLAVGGAGGTAWERCCLGLPTLLLTIASNQEPAACALAAAGAGVALGAFGGPGWEGRLAAALARLADPAALSALSASAAAVCDGRGAARAAAVLAAPPLRLRAAGPEDAERVWAWRRAGGAARFYRSGADPTLADHLAWWSRALGDPRRRLLMACDGDAPVAHLRLDAGPDGAATVGIVLAPERRGAGLAAPALEAALDDAARRGVSRVLAEVHEGNAASVRLFEGAGFAAEGADGPFRRYALALPSGRAENPGPDD